MLEGMVWQVQVSVPFTYAFSKNAVWGKGKHGQVYVREEAGAARDGLSWMLKAALRDVPLKQNRLWIDIFVQKPDHKGDAINVVDSVCDALKKVIPLDDRWYSISGLDWEIVKDDPHLYVGVGQRDVEDVRPCSHCGALLSLQSFSGKGRECNGCLPSLRAARKAK